jgi:hypothetical protein
MRSTSRNIFLTIVAFAVVTAAILSVRTFLRRFSPPLQSQQLTSDVPVKTPPPPQHVGGSGKAITQDGTPASFTSFATKDGAWLSQWSEFHDSPRSARRALEFALNHATQIIRREPLFDDGGHRIGEKAVATFSGQYAYYGDASLLWTDGSAFRYVSGSSLQNILDYDLGSP